MITERELMAFIAAQLRAFDQKYDAIIEDAREGAKRNARSRAILLKSGFKDGLHAWAEELRKRGLVTSGEALDGAATGSGDGGS